MRKEVIVKIVPTPAYVFYIGSAFLIACGIVLIKLDRHKSRSFYELSGMKMFVET
jgi:hypothetical protein